MISASTKGGRRGVAVRAVLGVVTLCGVLSASGVASAQGDDSPASTTTASVATTTTPTATVAPTTTPSQPAAAPGELDLEPPPVQTLQTEAHVNGQWGVESTDPTTGAVQFWPVNATGPTGGGPVWLQVVVLDRRNLSLVSNTTYGAGFSAASLAFTLGLLNTGKDLVIVASQPVPSLGAPTTGPANLSGVLAPIGVPDPPPSWAKVTSLGAGTFSAIGVPSTPDYKGTSTYNYGTAGTGSGDMTSYLVRNQDGNYVFQSNVTLPFTTTSEHPNGENVVEVGDQHLPSDGKDGWQLVTIDRATGAAHSAFFTMSGLNSAEAAGVLNQLIAALRAANDPATSDDVIMLVSVGRPVCTAYDCNRTNKPLQSRIGQLAYQVATAGGTATPVYDIMNSAHPTSMSYTLVGETNLGYGRGNGTTSTKGDPETEANTASQEGILTRSPTDYGYSVLSEELPGTFTPPVYQVVNERPGPWPNQDDPKDQAAIAYIGEKAMGTPNPRAAYYSEYLTNWGPISDRIKALTFPTGQDFGQANFDWAKGELLKEIGWVQSVKLYFDTLAAPYSQSSIETWAELTAIATNIKNEVQVPPTDKVSATVAVIFQAVIEIAREAGAIGKAIGVISTLLTSALEIAEINKVEPAEENFDVVAAELGSSTAQRLTEASEAVKFVMPLEVVADYNKLKTVAECSTLDPACPSGSGSWQLSPASYKSATRAIQLSLNRSFYGELLSAKYRVYSTPSGTETTPKSTWCSFRFTAGPGSGLPGDAPYANAPDGSWVNRPDGYDVQEQWVMSSTVNSPSFTNTFPDWQFPANSVTAPLWKPITDSGPVTETSGLGLNREQFMAQWFGPIPTLASELQAFFVKTYLVGCNATKPKGAAPSSS